MATLTMKTATGADGGTVELPDHIFGIEPNVAVMHQVVTAQLAAKRAGTHSTKTRSEVRGGGAKPWRQKGTGRARQGSIRAPQWRGGGVAHGPKPRDYSQRTPKKMVQLALRSALSDRASESKVVVVDDWAIDAPKTKDAVKLLEAIGLRTKGEREARVLVGAVPHRRERVEVVAQPRRPRADRVARGAEHLRRAAERLARVLAACARDDRRPAQLELESRCLGRWWRCVQ